jgi:hypothetical protein
MRTPNASGLAEWGRNSAKVCLGEGQRQRCVGKEVPAPEQRQQGLGKSTGFVLNRGRKNVIGVKQPDRTEGLSLCHH